MPIAPTGKNHKTWMQLKFCDDVYGDTGLSQRSFLQVDKIYEVPEAILQEQLNFRRHLQLKQNSYDGFSGPSKWPEKDSPLVANSPVRA